MITCGLLAGALTLPVSAFALGLGKLTVQSGLGQPLSAQRSSSHPRKRTNSIPCARESPIRRCIATTTSNIVGAMSRARIVVEQDRERRTVPARDDVAGGQRRLSRSDRRAQLGDRTRRARLHVPARSAGQHRNTGGRARARRSAPRPAPLPRRALRPAPRRRRCRRAPFGRRRSRRGCACRRVDLHGQARRHAVEDRPGIQARQRQPRADAGRAVPQQRERVRRQQHESAAHRADRHRAASRPDRRGTAKRGDAGRQSAGRGLARLSRPRRRGRAGDRCDRSTAIGERQDQHGGRGQGERSAAGQGSVARLARSRQGRRCGNGAGRRSRCQGQGVARSQFARRRAREDRARSAARGRAQESDDGRRCRRSAEAAKGKAPATPAEAPKVEPRRRRRGYAAPTPPARRQRRHRPQSRRRRRRADRLPHRRLSPPTVAAASARNEGAGIAAAGDQGARSQG